MLSPNYQWAGFLLHVCESVMGNRNKFRHRNGVRGEKKKKRKEMVFEAVVKSWSSPQNRDKPGQPAVWYLPQDSVLQSGCVAMRISGVSGRSLLSLSLF